MKIEMAQTEMWPSHHTTTEPLRTTGRSEIRARDQGIRAFSPSPRRKPSARRIVFGLLHDSPMLPRPHHKLIRPLQA
jgi:hypothetical protein